MKNVLLLVLLLLGFSSFGQKEIGSYEMSFFNSKPTYKISATEPKDEIISFYIETASVDRNSVTLIVRSKKIDEFKAILDSARVTYERWSKTAKENNVTELDKEIEIDKLSVEAAFHYGGWNFDFSVKLKARIKILPRGENLLIIENTNKLQSSSNQFIDSKGFYLAFSSSEEVSNFINSMSEEKVIKMFEQKNSKEDLFK